MKRTILFILVFISILCSCKKIGSNGNNCPSESAIPHYTITTNSPVVVGWPIYFTTLASMGDLFHWSGPNSWDINYSYYASDANKQQRLNASFADSGTYNLELKNADGCVSGRGTAIVKVIAPPSPPCSVPNNSCTSSVVGVGGVSFTYINFSSSAYYVVQATGGGNTLYFYFIGNVPPKPGVYKTSGYSPSDDTQVGCWISAFPYDFINQQGQNVYVNLVGGKTQVSFCNCNFSNPLGSTIPVISAKVTQP